MSGLSCLPVFESTLRRTVELYDIRDKSRIIAAAAIDPIFSLIGFAYGRVQGLLIYNVHLSFRRQRVLITTAIPAQDPLT